MAHLTSIVFQPEDQSYPDGRLGQFIRTPTQKVQLVQNHGIAGDRKAGRNARRQLNLLSTAWLAEKEAQGYKTEPGQFGEQLIVEGLDLESLAAGTRLKLGAEAIIEITMPRIGCTRLEAAQGAGNLDGTHIGVLSKVLSGGAIHVGDEVAVVAP